MKHLRSMVLLFLFLVLILAMPIQAQDLSRYRTYAFGMSLDDLRLQLDSQGLRTKLVHGPALIQEVVWWPWESSGPPRGDGLWQVLFRFHNSRLYRIEATYDRLATRGLTAADMVEAIAARYGSPTRLQAEGDSTIHLEDTTGRALAQWEDPYYSLTLYRSSLSDAFGLIIFSKQLDTQAILAIAGSAEAVRQDTAGAAVTRRDLAAEDLEADRQRNKKTLRP